MKRSDWNKITPGAWACDEWAVEFDAHVDHAERSHLGDLLGEIKIIETATRGDPQEMIDQVADRRDQENSKRTERARQLMKGVNQCD